MVLVKRPKPNVQVMPKKDVEALAQVGGMQMDMNSMLELEKLHLQQEQLKYMQTLRTGKPATSPTPVAKPASTLTSETQKFTTEINAVKEFQQAIFTANDMMRPKENFGELFLNSKFGEGMGEALGGLLAEEVRDWRRDRRSRQPAQQGPGPATVPRPAGAAPPAQSQQMSPQMYQPPQPQMSGFVGSYGTPPAPAPQQAPQPSPPQPAAGIGAPMGFGQPPPQGNAQPPAGPPRPELLLRFGEDDKAAIRQVAENSAKTSADVATLAGAMNRLVEIIGTQQARLDSLETGVASVASEPVPAKPRSRANSRANPRKGAK